METRLRPAPLVPVYDKPDVVLDRAEGMHVFDKTGRQYLDFYAGIAVLDLGHRHPECLAAAREQLDRIWHVSGQYWTRQLITLATRLAEKLGGGEVWICNSGAEAIEAAIKYARKATGKTGIVSLEASFH